MLHTVLLASLNAAGTVYIGPAPDKLNQAFTIPAVQFVWTDVYAEEGREYRVGTLRLTAALWETWWGERMDDLWPWARDFREFAERLVRTSEHWLACPLGCHVRMATLEEYEQHIREHLAEMIALHEEYLGVDKLPIKKPPVKKPPTRKKEEK